jgi:hypothetical protein
MNCTTLSLVTLAAALSLAACDAPFRPRKQPAAGPKPADTGTVMIPDESAPDSTVPDTRKPDEVIEPSPFKRNKIPPPPTPNNPEYAIKVEGKPGYVKSPYDSQGRLIDVRGLPPGTEAECPYTRRTFLVPP